MRLTCELILLLTFATAIFAQAPDTLWTRTYGGAFGEFVKCVRQTTDGGYVISGSTWSFGPGTPDSSNIYIVKTDSLGDTLWTKAFGGTGGDWGCEVQQTTDGGYVVVGTTESFGGGSGLLLLKIDMNGDTLWTKTYGGSGYSIQLTSDGGYIICGSFGGIWLLKTDANGDTVWTRAYNNHVGYSVQQTLDGGYIIAGITGVYPDYEIYYLKTNANGDTLWSKTYGEASWNWGSEVQQTTDGGYIITGYIRNPGGAYVILIKTDADGDTVWVRTYGDFWAWGYSGQQTADGGYIVTGLNADTIGTNDLYIVKTNVNGDTLWTRTYGGTHNDFGCSVRQTTDGGYIIAGQTSSFGAGHSDFWLLKTDTDTLGVRGQEMNPATQSKMGATIFSGPLLLPEGKNCRVFDITGRVVIHDKIKPGIYFIEIDGKITQKVVKVR